mmetsp:Transcript_11831/g.21619  ORF Transcript_11831/g.21619 Transcript_11831/m.21619 type:complete len:268 (-) Transcript_11831:1566-2369(-)
MLFEPQRPTKVLIITCSQTNPQRKKPKPQPAPALLVLLRLLLLPQSLATNRGLLGRRARGRGIGRLNVVCGEAVHGLWKGQVRAVRGGPRAHPPKYVGECHALVGTDGDGLEGGPGGLGIDHGLRHVDNDPPVIQVVALCQGLLQNGDRLPEPILPQIRLRDGGVGHDVDGQRVDGPGAEPSALLHLVPPDHPRTFVPCEPIRVDHLGVGGAPVHARGLQLVGQQHTARLLEIVVADGLSVQLHAVPCVDGLRRGLLIPAIDKAHEP